MAAQCSFRTVTPMHPVSQQCQPYVYYSPQTIPPQGRSHHHQYYASQPHSSSKHRPKAIAWHGAIPSSTPQRLHGKDGDHERSRRSHAPAPPDRKSRHRKGGKPSPASGAKHHSHGKSRREVDDGKWSTTAQKAHSSKHGAHRNSHRKVANDTWSTTAQKGSSLGHRW